MAHPVSAPVVLRGNPNAHDRCAEQPQPKLEGPTAGRCEGRSRVREPVLVENGSRAQTHPRPAFRPPLAACAAEPAEQIELPEPARFTADHLRWLEAKAENTPIGCVTELGHSSPNWRYLPLECDGVEQKGDGEGQKIPALRFDDLSALACEETRPCVELAFDEGDTYLCTNECDNYTSRIAVFRVSGDDFDGYLAADVDARRVDEEAWRSWIEGTSFDLGE